MNEIAEALLLRAKSGSLTKSDKLFLKATIISNHNETIENVRVSWLQADLFSYPANAVLKSVKVVGEHTGVQEKLYLVLQYHYDVVGDRKKSMRWNRVLIDPQQFAREVTITSLLSN